MKFLKTVIFELSEKHYKLTVLAIAMLLSSVLINAPVAVASDGCEFHSGGYLQTVFLKGDEKISYKLVLSEGEWEAWPIGHHATAGLSRNDSIDDSRFNPKGLLFVYAHGAHYQSAAASIVTQSEQPIEFVGYPHTGLGAENLRLLENDEEFQLSGLSGSAKIYEIVETVPYMSGLRNSVTIGGKSLGLVSIKVSDRCGELYTSIVFAYSDQPLIAAEQILRQLKSQAQIVVEKGTESEKQPQTADCPGYWRHLDFGNLCKE